MSADDIMICRELDVNERETTTGSSGHNGVGVQVLGINCHQKGEEESTGRRETMEESVRRDVQNVMFIESR